MNTKYPRVIRSFLIAILLTPFGAAAGTSSLQQPPEIQSLWTDNSRWAVDLSARTVWDEEKKKAASQFILGFDFHKVFSNRSGDIGTLVFQPYIVKLKDVKNHAFFFDDEDDTELTWRIANFNYTGLSNGSFNIRAGHFEVPFGLEQNLDTNGTTRQFTYKDRGIKADWGVSVNGVIPSLDYEIALTRGSSNEYVSRDNPYVFAGRIGTSSIANFVSGFSWLSGDILTGNGTVSKNRLGLDFAYYYKQWEALLEISGGDNDGTNTANAFAELSWRNPLEDVHTYWQLRHQRVDNNDEWVDANSMSIGINWQVNQFASIGAEYLNELDTLMGQDTASRVMLQARLRL